MKTKERTILIMALVLARILEPEGEGRGLSEPAG
jgi:hypothetical protein